jgi:hypothetical protein
MAPVRIGGRCPQGLEVFKFLKARQRMARIQLRQDRAARQREDKDSGMDLVHMIGRCLFKKYCERRLKNGLGQIISLDF